MIALNKNEKEAVRERFPGVHIVRTMKQKSKRHRYYCEESAEVIKFLKKIRGTEDDFKKRGAGRYKSRKNA